MILFSLDEINITLEINPNKISSLNVIKNTQTRYRLAQEIRIGFSSRSNQTMNTTPLLQIAMDYISLPKALAMAVLVAPEVDIIEIGTPLCKAAGLEAIRSMREICPDKLILADFKAPDVGGLEATMAFDAGADMMSRSHLSDNMCPSIRRDYFRSMKLTFPYATPDKR